MAGPERRAAKSSSLVGGRRLAPCTTCPWEGHSSPFQVLLGRTASCPPCCPHWRAVHRDDNGVDLPAAPMPPDSMPRVPPERHPGGRAVLVGSLVGVLVAAYILAYGWVSCHRTDRGEDGPAMVAAFGALGLVAFSTQLFGNAGRRPRRFPRAGRPDLVACPVLPETAGDSDCLRSGAAGGVFTPTSAPAPCWELPGAGGSQLWAGAPVGAFAMVGAGRRWPGPPCRRLGRPGPGPGADPQRVRLLVPIDGGDGHAHLWWPGWRRLPIYSGRLPAESRLKLLPVGRGRGSPQPQAGGDASEEASRVSPMSQRSTAAAAAAPLGDGPGHQALAPAHVAAGEDAGDIGSPLARRGPRCLGRRGPPRAGPS